MSTKLDKQIFIYNFDTSAFYNENEQKIHEKLRKCYFFRQKLNKSSDKCKKHSQYINNRINKLKNKLYFQFKQNKNIRHLREDALKDNKIIAIFESTLTRTLKLKHDTLTKDIMVVQAYFFEVLEDIIHNGFIYNGQKYVYFSSSAGQIRTKKSVFIKESVWNQYKNSLTCGLSAEEINSKGGININKYQAYMALSNSASEEWKNFNIHRSIVVEDLETNVFGEVDYIDRDTFEIKRRKMNVPITHTDGCGMILPKKSKKSFMCRLPFVKGLLVPFPFDKFAENHNSFLIKDIYGKEWDIKKDNIEVIFTRSQFKMAKYFSDWKDYQDRFIKYHCQAAKLNEEDVSTDATLNYQMLQTLTDITENELREISKSTIDDIMKIGSDKETMLRILGATKTNKHKNYFQQALEIYPELLNDIHARQVIKDKKRSMIKDAKAAKLKINGKYTFIIPDLYAFCEYLFLNNENPSGLLKNKEVYCDLFDNVKLDLLRSPHLYREHGIRQNNVDEEKSKWFITHGVYTGVHDLISKMLQFDNDGDKALVVADEILVSVAERNMRGIVPLYYEMAKAGAEQINYKNIYKSLTLAYKANIGIISNDITKIWNNKDVNLKPVKWLTMINNFVIDYAKTLFMPNQPEHVKKEIHKYIKTKLPHFFVYAKDKDESRVAPINDSVVNRLEYIIPNKPIQFKQIAGDLNYKLLMKRKKVELNEEIIKEYIRLDRNKKWLTNQGEHKTNDKLYIYKLIRNKLLSIHNDPEYIADMLVRYLYGEVNSKHKTTLWESFGDILIRNLKENIKGTKQCESCGARIKVTSNRTKYCHICWKKHEKELWRNNKRKNRK